MLFWDFMYVLMLLICLEAIGLVVFFLIKVLIKKDTKFNYKKKTVGKFIVGTFLTSLLITCISTGYNTYNHVGENEIGFYSQNDINQVKEVLVNNHFNYDVVGKKIKMQNYDDVQKVLNILIDSGISFRM